MNTVYLDGQFVDAAEARISPLDRGFLFADGVYEVVPVFNGVPFRIEEHLQRLERSMRELQIDNPHPREQWRALCGEIVSRNGGGNVSIYVQVTRGTAAKRDHVFPVPAVPPTVFMSASPLSLSPLHNPDSAVGAKALTREDNRWDRCDIKSVALLPNILFRQMAQVVGAAEVILTRNGCVTEGSSTNVFVVKNGRIATPPISNRILAGVTRNLTVEICRQHGLPIEEREVTKAELEAADELWITSSTKDVLPIVALEGRAVGGGRPGPVWKELAGYFLAYKRKICNLG
ncbi:D-amino acid aminotransferase [Solimonas flava]|uniref:D-amino acid aminotransferase n=1 Tax=Solimonas flava TaxID=415849 RepID=UPI0004265C7D|nr:D-amino acid aminotransferase [Solimonas flava]